jgi:hypothetical protein
MATGILEKEQRASDKLVVRWAGGCHVVLMV